MSINTQALFDTAKARFGAESSEQRFQNVFFDALKMVSADFQARAKLEFDAPEDLQTDIDLDIKFYSAVSLGTMTHIATHGEWLIEDSTNLERRYDRALAFAQLERFRDDCALGKLGDLS